MLRPPDQPRISDDLRALLEASPNAIVAVDADGRIVYANPRVATTFGYAPDEIVGNVVDMLVPSDLADLHKRHRSSFMAQPSARPMGIGLDLAGRRRDGSAVPVEISLVPLDTAGGRLVFATIVDITARKSLEAQLAQAQKMESVGRLAGGIAHDFNNMLFAIRSFTDMLAEDIDASPVVDPSVLRASIEGIDHAADQAAQLTAQLLAFSRQQVIQPTTVDVREIVASIEPMLRRLIGEQVRLRLALGDAPLPVKVDPNQLHQVLVNLVVNARDAMPDGGAIAIEASRVQISADDAREHDVIPPGAYALLAVSDTGIGMDEATRRRVFEPFFTTKAVGKGTGLGLALVYGVVTQAAGHITVESEVGVGTTFRIFLPEAAAETSAVAEEDGRPHAGRGRILLVEDERYVREAATLVLERAGFSVSSTGDPMAALATIEAVDESLDVLVTDVVMPDLSGRELAERAMTVRPGMGIVLLSGYTPETSDVADLVERGAQFASKPLSARNLVALVASAVPDARPGDA
jgi:PAS domain S-box-containing protein